MPKRKKVKSGRYSEILPASQDSGLRGLLVGNADFAADEAALDEAGVTAVLTVGGKQRAQARDGRACKHCSVADAEEVSMLPLFEPTSAWIQEQRTASRSSTRPTRPLLKNAGRQAGAVLVHCTYVLSCCLALKRLTRTLLTRSHPPDPARSTRHAPVPDYRSRVSHPLRGHGREAGYG